MVKLARASDVKPGFLVQSVLEAGEFVPVRRVSRENGRVVIETHESTMRLRPSSRLMISVARSPALSSKLAKRVMEYARSMQEATPPRRSRTMLARAVAEMSGAADTVAEAGSDRAAASMMRLMKQASRCYDSEDAADLAVATERWLRRYGHYLPERRKEPLKIYRWGNEWQWNKAYADVMKKRPHLVGGDDDDTEGLPRGAKVERPSCDSCGAPLRRKGPALKPGWGLYVCDYCGSEYSVKER